MLPSQISSVRASEPLTGAEVRTLALASLGGTLEFYDFVIFAFFTVVIGKVFFPPGLTDSLRQMQTFGLFAAGYLARPLGGIVMAHFGDTRGRKRMFTLSVLVMAIPTLLIGFLPTYRSIGMAAPLLLLLFRMLQGIAIGGEAPGGWVFVAEHAPANRLGLATGLLTSGLISGILLGSLIASGMDLIFTQAQITAGLWRLPFLLGGVFGLIAMVLRRWLEETPVFEAMKRRAALSKKLPLRVAIKDHGRAIVASCLISWTLAGSVVVTILMTPSLFQKLFALPARETQLANLGATAVVCVANVLFGIAVDRFGVRRVALCVYPLLIVSVYALYLGVAREPGALLPLYLFAGLGVGACALTPIVIIRAFPPAVRFSGFSFSYNIAYALLGGMTPLLVTWLVQRDRTSPAHYVAFTALLGLGTALLAPVAKEEALPATSLELQFEA